MRVIDLALKDLMQIIRDWRAAFFLLAMPIAFTLIFGFAFGGFGSDEGEPEDLRLPVAYLDQDEGSLAPNLRILLENSDVIRTEPSEAAVEDLEEQVADETIAAAVIVPPGYSEALKNGEDPSLIVILDSGSNAAFTAQGEINSAVLKLSSIVQTANRAVDTFEEQVGFGGSAEREAYFEDSLDRSINAWADSPITVVSTKTGDEIREETGEAENAFAQSSPGMMAQFAIAGLMGAASVIVLERKNRSLRRLLTTAISRPEILLGHYLAMYVMIFVQLLILVIFGQLLLQLNYFGQPLATFLMIIFSALFAASLGLLVGALAKSEEQVIIISLVLMFVLAALGGAWVPLEITPETFQRVAFLTPTAHMVDGFKDILIRGQGVESVLTAIVVLFGFSVLCFALAVWRFRFE